MCLNKSRLFASKYESLSSLQSQFQSVKKYNFIKLKYLKINCTVSNQPANMENESIRSGNFETFKSI